MRKVAIVFLFAVIVPSLGLAWLAVRSLRDQQLAIERQQTLLYQGVADGLARDIAAAVESRRDEFTREVAALLATAPPQEVARSFDSSLRERWPLAEVGFAVTTGSEVLSPSMLAGPEARKFRVDNDLFLCSRESVQVYWNSPKGAINLSKLDQQKESQLSKNAAPQPLSQPFEPGPDNTSQQTPGAKTAKSPRTVVPEKERESEALLSKVTAEELNFKQIVGDSPSGTLARFLQNKLKLLFWFRPSQESGVIFGAQVSLAKLAQQLKDSVRVESGLQTEICVALLDDTGKPVTLSRPDFIPEPTALGHGQNPVGRRGTETDLTRSLLDGGRATRRNLSHNTLEGWESGEAAPSTLPSFKPEWKRPFAATEIGEVLPHWEIAVYLLHPEKLGRAAEVARLAFGLLIATLVLAIGVGSWLIVADLNRQLTLARQKTDFVSNVSHELKTPLTSIRMFSELLAEDRVLEESKRRHYLGIITAEAARLTRLINNVLDFARMERGEKQYQFRDCDLGTLVRETLEGYRPHLEAKGFRVLSRITTDPIRVRGDQDALAQVLVNLLSNAEKYCGDQKEVTVEVAVPRDGQVAVRVLDRGLGIPVGSEEMIFVQFFRAHDSLASGIQGSGLGLTLARQIARAHGGDLRSVPRDEGGSCFVLILPVESEAIPA